MARVHGRFLVTLLLELENDCRDKHRPNETARAYAGFGNNSKRLATHLIRAKRLSLLVTGESYAQAQSMLSSNCSQSDQIAN